MGNQLWAKDVVLCVTGLTRQERQAAEEVITAAGGSAARNQHKWGLKLVSSGWLAACAECQAHQDERPFLALVERTPLATRTLNKESSRGGLATATFNASRATSVPDSCGQPPAAQYHHHHQQPQQQHQHQQHQLHVEGAGPSQVWRPVPSNLHTQLAEVKHSLRPGPAGTTAHGHSLGGSVHLNTDGNGNATSRRAGPDERQQVPRGSAVPGRTKGAAKGASKGESKGVSWAPLPDAAAERFLAQPVELGSQGFEADWCFEHLPLTQAGFMPTDDLLHHLQEQDQSASFSPLPRKPSKQPGSHSASPQSADKHGAALMEMEREIVPPLGQPAKETGMLSSWPLQPHGILSGMSAAAVAPDSWVQPAATERTDGRAGLQLAGRQQPSVRRAGADRCPIASPDNGPCSMPSDQQQQQHSAAQPGPSTPFAAVSPGPASPAVPGSGGDIASLLARLQQAQQAPAFTPLAARPSRRGSATRQDPSPNAATQQQQPARQAPVHAVQRAEPVAMAAKGGPSRWRAATELDLDRLVQQLQQAACMQAQRDLPGAPQAHAQPQLLEEQGQGHIDKVTVPGGQPVVATVAVLVQQLRAGPTADDAAAAALLGDAARAQHTAALLQQLQVGHVPITSGNRAPQDLPQLLQQLQGSLPEAQHQPVQQAEQGIHLPAGQPPKQPQQPADHAISWDPAALFSLLASSITDTEESKRVSPHSSLHTAQPWQKHQKQQRQQGQPSEHHGGDLTPPRPVGMESLLSMVLQGREQQQQQPEQVRMKNCGSPAVNIQAMLSTLQQGQQQSGQGSLQEPGRRPVDIQAVLSTLQQVQQQHPGQGSLQEPGRQPAELQALLGMLEQGRQQQAPVQMMNPGHSNRTAGIEAMLGMLRQGQQAEEGQFTRDSSGYKEADSRAVNLGALLSMLQPGQQQPEQQGDPPVEAGTDQEAGVKLAALLQQLQQAGRQQTEGKASDQVQVPPVGQQTRQGKAPEQLKQSMQALLPDEQQQGMPHLRVHPAHSQAQGFSAAKPQRPPRSEEAALRSLEKGLAAAILAAEEGQQQAAGQRTVHRSWDPAAAPALHGLSGPLPPGYLGMSAPRHRGQQREGTAKAPAAPTAAGVTPVHDTAQPAMDSPSVSETVLNTPSDDPTYPSQQQSCWQKQQPFGTQPGGMPSPMQLDWQQPARVAVQAGAAAAAGSAEPAAPEPTLVVPELPGQSSCADAAYAGKEGAQGMPQATFTTPTSSSIGGGGGSAFAVHGEGMDAGSAARGREAASQVAESVEGVFEGIAAILDPDLSEEEARRVAQALQQGGGKVVVGARLGQGATHVVCQPEAALRWLSLSLGIISPQWVVRSLKSGRQQRCLMVSADATRHLPAGPEQGCNQLKAPLRGTDSSRGSMSPLGQLQSKEARAAMLQQLAGHSNGPSPATGATLGAGNPGAPLCTPASMLVGFAWSVVDPPAEARPDSTVIPRLASVLQQYGPGDVIPDSEDEEDQFCLGATQAAYNEALNSFEQAQGYSQAAARGMSLTAHDSNGGGGSPAQHGWLQEAAGFPGAASITLLLPRDGRGELGHDSRCFALPGRAASPLELLHFVHSYYQEAIPIEEQVVLLRSSSAVHAVASVVKPAFLDMRPLARHQLLGPRLSLEGLFKITREPLGGIYELRLGC
ncbi:hypothetical protein N2152v2_010329 [Parachlorella kessleri]